MRKIADADELESELRRLVAYAQTEMPSRLRVAHMLTSLSARVAGVDVIDEDYLQNVARLFSRAVAKTRYIQGTPDFQTGGPNGTILYMRCVLQPYNDSGINSLDIWVTDGHKVKLSVAGTYVPVGGDVESQGFGHVSANENFVFNGESEAAFVQRIAKLALKMN